MTQRARGRWNGCRPFFKREARICASEKWMSASLEMCLGGAIYMCIVDKKTHANHNFRLASGPTVPWDLSVDSSVTPGPGRRKWRWPELWWGQVPHLAVSYGH